MSELKNIENALNELRAQIVNIGLSIGSFLGIIAYVLSVWNYGSTGFQISYLTDLIIVIAIIATTIYRHKIKLQIKSIIIIVLLFSTYCINLLQFGLLSTNKVLIVLIPFFSSIMFPFKRVRYIYILTILSFIIIAWLIVTEKTTLFFSSLEELNQGALWILNLFFLLLVTIIITVSFFKFNSTYIELFKEYEKKNSLVVEKEQSYREIFNSTADAILILDLKGKILEVNKAMLETFSFLKKEIPKITLSRISAGQEGATEKKAFEHIQTTITKGKTKFDWYAKKKSGQLFWVEVELKATEILGSKRILAVISDIDEKKWNALQLEKYKTHLETLVQERTMEVENANDELLSINEELFARSEELEMILNQLKETQEKLIHSEKMASLGVLSAGIAHEINNPLNFIQGGISGLEEYLKENDLSNNSELKMILDAMHEGVDRASTIVTSLNHFSHPGDSKTEVCNVQDILDNCLVILRGNFKGKIQIEKDYQVTNSKTLCNNGKLHQAFLNLISNAEQSIEGKGTIKLSIHENPHGIHIKISDTGCGISKENIQKIIDPFFTTKSPGSGTGLGLSITYNIIQEHGGNLEFHSEVGKGTTAFVTLPHKH